MCIIWCNDGQHWLQKLTQKYDFIGVRGRRRILLIFIISISILTLLLWTLFVLKRRKRRTTLTVPTLRCKTIAVLDAPT